MVTDNILTKLVARIENASASNFIQSMNLRSCIQLGSPGVVAITLPRLKRFELTGTTCFELNITNEAVRVLVSNCNCLEELIIHRAKFLTDAALETIASELSTSLRKLDISGCKRISDAGVGHLRSCKNLQDLEMAQCALESQAFINFCVPAEGTPPLRRLGVRGQIHQRDATIDIIMSALSTTLESIDITGCRAVTDTSLRYLASGVKLREVRFAGCRYLTHEGISGMVRRVGAGLHVLNSASCKSVDAKSLLADIVAHCPKLETLAIIAHGLDDAAMENAAKVKTSPTFKSVNISMADRATPTELTDYGLGVFAQKCIGPTLVSLVLTGLKNITTDGLLLACRHCVRLSHLDARGTNVSLQRLFEEFLTTEGPQLWPTLSRLLIDKPDPESMAGSSSDVEASSREQITQEEIGRAADERRHDLEKAMGRLDPVSLSSVEWQSLVDTLRDRIGKVRPMIAFDIA